MFVTIPGLSYNGKQVGYDDGTTVSVPPTTNPPVVTSPDIHYPVSKLLPNVTQSMLPTTVAADRAFLKFASYTYQQDLRSLRGSHQLYFDMLTNATGKTFSDGVPQPANTVNDPTLKTQINWIINDTSYNGPLRDDPAYNGPLKQIYQNLVKSKLAGA